MEIRSMSGNWEAVKIESKEQFVELKEDLDLFELNDVKRRGYSANEQNTFKLIKDKLEKAQLVDYVCNFGTSDGFDKSSWYQFKTTGSAEDQFELDFVEDEVKIRKTTFSGQTVDDEFVKLAQLILDVK